MFQNGLLVVSVSTALRRSSVSSLIQRCSQFVRETLYVHLVSDDADFSDHSTQPSRVPLVQGVRRYVTDFYTNASHLSKSMDVRFLLSNITNEPTPSMKPHRLHHDYDVILTDVGSDRHPILLQYIRSVFPSVTMETKVLRRLEDITVADIPALGKSSDVDVSTFDYVALGGTFDRLHVGHKILLSEGCLLCNKALTVGVTDGDMIQRKILSELMQPISDRTRAVGDFLSDIRPDIEHRVVAITDLYGPTITDPSIQCLVVSRETIRGGDMINSKRAAQGMSELKLEIIELVEDLGHSVEEEDKVSSSTSRIRLLGTLLKKRKGQRSHDRKPFVIGLTGGTASGKTSVGRRLEKLGAGIVDCDVLGHRSYQPGTPTFRRIVEVFGNDVVDGNGSIDRRILGSKVFGNREMMNRLNEIVWPAIAQLAAEEMKKLANGGKQVVIMDAAVLLEAGWDKMVDEVWTTVIPRDEAVRRLMERNKLTEDEAQKRIDSQITNVERVTQADVVLCTLWEPEFTQKQVEKAWALLKERLTSVSSAL